MVNIKSLKQLCGRSPRAKSCAFFYTSQSVPTGKDTPCLRAHLSHRTQGPYGTRCRSKVNEITGPTLRRSSCSTLEITLSSQIYKKDDNERCRGGRMFINALGHEEPALNHPGGGTWEKQTKKKRQQVRENKHSPHCLCRNQPPLRHSSLRLCQTPRHANRLNYDNAGKRRAPSS